VLEPVLRSPSDPRPALLKPAALRGGRSRR
jgi:hypothetical protein